MIGGNKAAQQAFYKCLSTDSENKFMILVVKMIDQHFYRLKKTMKSQNMQKKNEELKILMISAQSYKYDS